jgi:hypothetical protein
MYIVKVGGVSLQTDNSIVTIKTAVCYLIPNLRERERKKKENKKERDNERQRPR